jgi:antitoxin VapB
MALVIDNPETERLVEELARKTGHKPDEAIAELIREKLEGPAGPQAAPESEEERLEAVRARIRTIQDRVAAMPDIDTRSADEIIGYDEYGVPR